MKIKFSPKVKKSGNALLVTTFLCSFLCVGILGYLNLVDQETTLSARSQAWNSAMAVLESGTEEGLEQLYTNPSNLTADGWTFDGTYYWRTNTLPDGNGYTVQIDNSNPNTPYITSRAYINLPAS